eukprot:6177992-Pleurochrysis_carterae.AAC.3
MAHEDSRHLHMQHDEIGINMQRASEAWDSRRGQRPYLAQAPRPRSLRAAAAGSWLVVKKFVD